MNESLQTFELGEFVLDRRLGAGGMGEVWGGRHVRSGAPVAVKVITGSYLLDEKWLSSFRAEVQAVATMNHSGIVGVYDYGFIPEEVEAASSGQIQRGSPYLVMEFADKGCLDDILSPTFEQIRRLLSELLAALAHAHARGVIHLDLKPANVLLARDAEGRDRVKLSDFGIAFDAGRLHQNFDVSRFQTLSGTPAYMAPEQIMSYWRDYGPWTDLYALGCMTWELCVGDVPFQADALLLLVQKHLSEEPPAFHPTMHVPPGFEVWVRRLLAKSPQHRFYCAAEALHELNNLEGTDDPGAGWRPLAFKSAFEPRDEPAGGTFHIIDEKETAAIIALRQPASTPSLLFGDTMQEEFVFEQKRRSGLETTMLLSPIRAPERLPFPSDWREDALGNKRQRSEHSLLQGAGLGLWGLREPRFVDRHDARDAIWSTLASVHKEGGQRLLFLTGESGVGKSRLAQWMSRRAHEVGAFRVLRATHSQHGGLFDGVEGMLRREFGLVGLDRAAAYERILANLASASDARRGDQELEASEFTELLFPSPDGEKAAALRAPRARWSLVMRMFEKLAKQQPLLICLEDVHLSIESLSLARHILETSTGSFDALFVCTSLPVSSVVDAKRARALLDLLELERCQSREVTPLEAPDQKELLGELLLLEPALSERLVEQTGGNPTFAIQLVSSWIERGSLIAGEAGYTLDPRVVPSAASDVSALCELRLEGVIAESGLDPEACWLALELAALLGGEVERQEWLALCRSMGLFKLELLITRMVDAGLVITRESRWSFSPRAYIDALDARVQREGRHAMLHGAIADWLITQQTGDLLERVRVLSHLIETDRFEESRNLLLVLVPSISSDQSQEFARRLLERLANIEGEDASRLRIEVELGGALTSKLISGEIEQVRERLEALSRGPHASLVRSDPGFVLLLATLATYEENFAEAISLLEPYCRDEQGIANVYGVDNVVFNKMLRRLGEAYRYSGQLEDALESLDEAGRLALSIGSSYEYAWASYSRAAVLVDTEHMDKGIEALQHTMQVMQQNGDRLGLSTCADLMGIYFYEQEDFSRACGYFRRAMVHAEACQDSGAWISRENLARCLLRVGRYEESLELARMIEREHVERGRELIFLHPVDDVILTCIAGLGRWGLWPRQWELAQRQFAVLEAEYDPGAEGFELLLDLLLDKEEVELARALFERLEERWRELGAEDALERIFQRRARIPVRG
jgi:serine/threonine protein kinase/tetratricopeptide (TPR) repeat protein